jgi:hypothetical protein
MVLAVYMPPHEPEPGIARRSISPRSCSLRVPAVNWPTCLEDADDVQVLALVAAGEDGAAVDVDRRHVGAQDPHHAAGHVLVAAADHEHAVHPLPADAGLDAVGDHLARRQAVLHALGAHRHAVADGRRAEDLRVAAGFLDTDDGGVGELLQAGVAGRDGRVAVGDADHRLGEVAAS